MSFSTLLQKYTGFDTNLYPYSTFAKCIVYTLNFHGKQILYWQHQKSSVGYEKSGEGEFLSSRVSGWREGLLLFSFSHPFNQHVFC